MVTVITVNGILAAILYGGYLWTPWAGLILSTLSALVFGFGFLNSLGYGDGLEEKLDQWWAVIIGCGISLLAMILSVVALFV
tara:strand:- start:1458 stop:1703 length:246 start_codon:yes stop_codon:yes gene_type:complete